MSYSCRHCGSPLTNQVLDLGHQPPSNAYLSPEALQQPETYFPLCLYVCTNCWLVQLPAYTSADTLFTSSYAYMSSASTSWLSHSRDYCNKVISDLDLDENSYVIELASNDGYLLQFFQQKGIPCLGIEPTHSAATVSKSKGITTLEKFFDSSLAQTLQKADLIIANNVLAHVPDINDFVLGIKHCLKESGLASIEFPHLSNLIKYTQFDTIYHEHFSYLSLGIVSRICRFVGLQVYHVEKIKTHGGSLRVWITYESYGPPTQSVQELVSEELDQGLNSIEVFDQFQSRSIAIKNDLIKYLMRAYEESKRVCGYGAAAKGNTLLNYAGLSTELLPCVADISLSKQGKYLPGTHIPVVSPEQLIQYQPDELLVLPWNLLPEIRNLYKDYPLITAIPELSVAYP